MSVFVYACVCVCVCMCLCLCMHACDSVHLYAAAFAIFWHWQFGLFLAALDAIILHQLGTAAREYVR